MMHIPILLLNLFLLGIGLAIVLTKRSIIFIIIGVELIIQAAISNYIAFNNQDPSQQDPSQQDGQVLAIFATAISICEIVMILAISLRLHQAYSVKSGCIPRTCR